MVTAYPSSQEAVVSCQGGAFPSGRRDPVQGAFPSEGPSGAACQGAGPSYLQGEEPGDIGDITVSEQNLSSDPEQILKETEAKSEFSEVIKTCLSKMTSPYISY